MSHTVAQLAWTRQHRGLTQAQVADTLGVSQMAVSRWEHGHRRPTFHDVARWANALGYEVALLRRDPS
jgi:UDP-N-acetylglucosamine 1-carboxyvinyltransferase